jgi:hypothetical protein
MKRLTTLLMLSVLAGCSVVDGATTRSCDWYKKCGRIGSGETYSSYDDCLTDQRASWLKTFPTDKCEGRIDDAAQTACYHAIEDQSCSDILDYVNLFSKCNSDEVCSK